MKVLIFAAAAVMLTKLGAYADEKALLRDAVSELYTSKPISINEFEKKIAPASLLLHDIAQYLFIVRSSSGGIFVLRRLGDGKVSQWNCSDSMSFSVGSSIVVPTNATLLLSDGKTGDFSILFETNNESRWIYLTSDKELLRWVLVSRGQSFKLLGISP